MIIVDYSTKKVLQGKLWQYNYGQVLRIQGGNLQKAQEIHFALEETGGESVPRIGITRDGVTDVVIPDTMLENNDSEVDYPVYVFIYNRDETSGETVDKFVLNVLSRSKPEHTGGSDDGDAFGKVIKEVNSAAERAESAEKQAGEYAEQTKDDAIKTGEDRTAIAEMVDSVSGIGEQVETVKEYKDQAQTAATNALLSEQKSNEAKEVALQAQAGAETAEDMAEQHALEVSGDKVEVEKLATQVRQDKSSVEQTVQGFGSTVQQAEQSINTAKTKAVEAVNTTKSDAVKAVQTEGTKQAEAVQAKGQEVINSIPSDYTTQMATKLDKQQGTENAGKALVIGDDGNVVPGEPTQQIEVDKTLTQERQAADAKATGDKILQYAIKATASGESIVLTDSAEEKLLNFSMQGKTEQASTEGKNLFDANGIDATRHILGNLSGFSDIDVGSYNLSNLIPVKEGENIVKSGTTGSSVVGFLGEDKSFLKGVSITDGKPVAVPAGAFYFCCNIAVANLKNKIQIEKGNTATPYEPYTGAQPSPSQAYPQEITSAGKLNADTGKYEVNVQISSGNLLNLEMMKNENGKIDSNSSIAKDVSSFDVVKGRKYLLLGKGDGSDYSSLHLGDDSLHYGTWKSFILSTGIGYRVFNKYKRIRKAIIASDDATITKYILHGSKVMKDCYDAEELGLFEISDNNTNIDYEPYKGLQKVQFQLDRQLTKWDRIEKRDDVWGVAYQTGHIQSYNGESVETEYISTTGGLDTGAEVYYKLDSEEFVALGKETQTALNNLRTYYPTTVMSNSEDCEMEVEYVADTKNYVDKQIQAIATKQIETNNLILERMM